MAGMACGVVGVGRVCKGGACQGWVVVGNKPETTPSVRAQQQCAGIQVP